jgi:hypothetical protein
LARSISRGLAFPVAFALAPRLARWTALAVASAFAAPLALRSESLALAAA